MTSVSSAYRQSTSLVVWIACWNLSSAWVSAQYDPQAAEPVSRLAGAVVMHGGGEVSGELRRKFIELSGGESARLVVLGEPPKGTDAAADELTAWREVFPGELSLLDANAVEPDAALSERLGQATGVWISGPRVQATIGSLESERRRQLAEMLQHVVARGGAIGGSAEAAEWMGAWRVERSETALTRPGLGLVAQTMIVTSAPEEGDAELVPRALSQHPDQLGVTIPSGSALILRGRSLEAVGTKPVRVVLAASARRPTRVEELSGGQRADWIALCRAAQARQSPPFPPAVPPIPRVEQGSLMIVGGGKMSNELMTRLIQLAGGPEAPFVYIPCEERETLPREPGFIQDLQKAGARHVICLHTKNRQRANSDEEFLAPLKTARGVWLGGGRQWNFVDSYQNTTVHRLCHEVLARGGVIAGSSAGASIQGDYMPRGDPLGNTVMMAEGYERGLGFITGVAIDQHFTQRKRLPDLQQLVRTFPQLLGIGIDEGTALIVSGSQGEVMGPGNVTFLSLRGAAAEAEPAVTVVGSGQRFDLSERRVLDDPQRR